MKPPFVSCRMDPTRSPLSLTGMSAACVRPTIGHLPGREEREFRTENRPMIRVEYERARGVRTLRTISDAPRSPTCVDARRRSAGNPTERLHRSDVRPDY